MKYFPLLFRTFALILLSSACTHAKNTAVIVDTTTGAVLETIENGQWTHMQDILKDKKLPQHYQLFKFDRKNNDIAATGLNPDQCADASEENDIVYRVSFSEKVEPGQIAIGNLTWEPMPRQAKVLKPQNSTYEKAVRKLLNEKGLNKAKVKITQLLKIDLEGDGVDEVLLSASHLRPRTAKPQPQAADKHGRPLYAAEGDYSFVQLRKVVNGRLVTEVLTADFHPPRSREEAMTPPNAPITYTIEAVMDLNGDGRMEPVIRAVTYAVQWISIKEVSGAQKIDHPHPATYRVGRKDSCFR
jgi:ribosomal protein L12E/L44/L45/RPP1/RPP2